MANYLKQYPQLALRWGDEMCKLLYSSCKKILSVIFGKKNCLMHLVGNAHKCKQAKNPFAFLNQMSSPLIIASNTTSFSEKITPNNQENIIIF